MLFESTHTRTQNTPVASLQLQYGHHRMLLGEWARVVCSWGVRQLARVSATSVPDQDAALSWLLQPHCQ